ncbi:MAG TPA: P1 family peptidase [Acidimicrobiia bacterium]|nr:P1 family peptidase [Acidimicrobiia bacterium]
MSETSAVRARLRNLGFAIGTMETGPENAITDVPGVLVGHSTLIRDEPEVVRTGITMVVPREGVWTDYVHAGSHVLNGDGEMTGLIWVAESGMLGSPIGITSTSQVGMVRDFLVAETYRLGVRGGFHLPVVGETWDGWLSTPGSFPLTSEHAAEALGSAVSGPVAEGSVGGGTGMICHDFKAGIGTSSRVATAAGMPFTVGVLVQANYGSRPDLRVDGVPVGREIGYDVVPSAWRDPPVGGSILTEPPDGGSIIILIATDAPLLPVQCRRLAQRATVGLARVGGYGHESSGDIFIAFSTGNHLGGPHDVPYQVTTLPLDSMDEIFHAAADATEEAIVNALCAATTMTGRAGHVAHALPLDTLVEVMARHRTEAERS